MQADEGRRIETCSTHLLGLCFLFLGVFYFLVFFFFFSFHGNMCFEGETVNIWRSSLELLIKATIGRNTDS